MINIFFFLHLFFNVTQFILKILSSPRQKHVTTHGGCSVRPVGRILFRPGSTGIFSVGGGQTRGGRGMWSGEVGGVRAAQVPQQIRGGKPAANSCAIVAADGGMWWSCRYGATQCSAGGHQQDAPAQTSRSPWPPAKGAGGRSPDQWVAGTPLEDHQPLTAHNPSVDFNRQCLIGRSVCFMLRANRKWTESKQEVNK